jgi:UDP-N-acetylglucosamine 4,6-dehydratase
MIRRLIPTTEKIVAFSRNESVQARLREALGNPASVEWILGDVRDPESLYDAMHRIDTIIHAAALKRVDGNDPRELYSVNIDGTIQVVRAALKRKVPKVLVLSTDKACAPATAYGASKLAAEFYAVYANRWANPHTRISCTRWGNVLGSAGSVLPTWRRQAAAGQPLTITDPSATRFWITMDQAVSFVLQALDLMRGGEVFIPVMRSTTLADMAALVAPGARTRRIPMRAGEKIHEVVISRDELPRAVSMGGCYYVINPASPAWPYQEPDFASDVTAEVSSETVPKFDLLALAKDIIYI